MKTVYLSALIVMFVLGFGVGEVFGWSGEIDLEPISGDDKEYGDILTLKVSLRGADPLGDKPVIITFVEKNTGEIIKTDSIARDNFTRVSSDDNRSWAAKYVIDTTNSEFNLNTTYDVEFVYSDKHKKHTFIFNQPTEKAVTLSGNEEENSISKSDSISVKDPEIPTWVRNVFTFWVEKQISDKELISALEYLIDVDIIKVNNP